MVITRIPFPTLVRSIPVGHRIELWRSGATTISTYIPGIAHASRKEDDIRGGQCSFGCQGQFRRQMLRLESRYGAFQLRSHDLRSNV
jgi:hypothetical protein